MRRTGNTGVRLSADKRLMTILLAGTAMTMATPVWAQDAPSAEPDQADQVDEIVVTGIRASLQSALSQKRNADNLVEVIEAEDIGKLPDQNLAEVLENVTGIQITREAGVGRGVQIRGTDANRVEINGVSTVGSGSGRSGISFDDLAASMIRSVEVIKVSEAGTIEGSVGGTINLRTIRPLELTEPLFAFRAQSEFSDLSDTSTPRYSGTVGHRWDTGIGEIGLVGSFSYAEQDVAAFRPRVDRDAVVTPTSGRASAEAFPFLRIQFFNQDYDNFEYETRNFAGTAEWKPTDNLRLYFDAVLNDQERAEQSTTVQISTVSDNGVVDNTRNTAFETVNLGSANGPNGTVDLGSVQATVAGIIQPRLNGNLAPYLRTTSDTGSRVTESRVFALGGEWQGERLTVKAEAALSTSDSVLPSFNTTLEFVNPNSPRPTVGVTLANGVPIEFDLRGGTLQFGIAQGLATTPTAAMLRDPANYRLQQVAQGRSLRENEEKALRLDASYDTDGILPFVTSIDAGLRWNETSVLNDNVTGTTSFTNLTTSFFRPSGNLFSDLLIAGPSNFNAADDRRLYFPDFLVVDGARAFRDPAGTLAALNAAITASNTANGSNIAQIGVPTSQSSAFFEITEDTQAAYLQANFDTEAFGMPVRGNVGFRYVTTDLTSIGNAVATGGTSTRTENDASYAFWLPRFNLVVEPAEDVVVRAGIARDIRRPDFNNLSSSVSFATSENTSVVRGNPDLQPEAVLSFDLSAEYYFAPSSLISVGVFHKVRDNLFASITESPPDNAVGGVVNRSRDPNCPGGGIYNPIAIINQNNPARGQTGICVPLTSTFNVDGETTQTGVELALQYDLSQWEDRLGWASGFGFIGNFTYQETGGDVQNYRTIGLTRNTTRDLGISPLPQDLIELENLSKYSYNTTLYYERYGLSARMRYTWRSDYLNTEAFTSAFDVPRVSDDRGQLNASVNYDLTPWASIGIEAINLTREDANEFCINDDALLCYNGLTDRRVTAGLSVRF
ncbi:TonB-dependent receptor [Brevundimonas subvibrioides ATCC 15264]|uniref:TonB-dependent receptor n=2 Tax=Brevundimonas subvibrioides TaxID=74313 RepID=D9QNH0_BRESC|nr:TonB-dependent receptor [Brevundimonas subvibrioides ATCC 15264]